MKRVKKDNEKSLNEQSFVSGRDLTLLYNLLTNFDYSIFNSGIEEQDMKLANKILRFMKSTVYGAQDEGFLK